MQICDIQISATIIGTLTINERAIQKAILNGCYKGRMQGILEEAHAQLRELADKCPISLWFDELPTRIEIPFERSLDFVGVGQDIISVAEESFSAEYEFFELKDIEVVDAKAELLIN